MLIDAIASSLFLPFCIINSIPEKIRIKPKLTIFIMSSIMNFLGYYFSNIKIIYSSSNFLAIASCLLITIISTKEKWLNLLSSIFGYIISVVFNNIIIMFLDIVFDLSPAKITNSLQTLILFYIFNFTCIFLILRKFRAFIRKLDFNSLKKYKVSTLILTELVICITILVFNISYGKIINYPSETIYFNCILFVLYFILSIALIGKILNTSKQAIIAYEKEKQFKELENYIKMLNENNQRLRKFQHDYLNILFTLDLLIKDKNIDALEQYFQEHILTTKNQLDKDAEILLPLANIMDIPIKSLLYAKFHSAISNKINISLIIDELISVPTLKPIEVARILGILLDNAIEASLDAEEPEITFSLTETETDCIIILSNTINSSLRLSIDNILDYGFSTKGEERGIGLNTVTEILNEYDNIITNISINGNIFTFTITITER